MNIILTAIEGVVILEPRVFTDSRGYFFESYNKEVFEKEVGHVDFVQDNESCSSRGVMRGLHFQRPPHARPNWCDVCAVPCLTWQLTYARDHLHTASMSAVC